MTVAKEISKYKLDLEGVQEVRWDRGGTELASEYKFSYGKGNENHELCTGVSVHKRALYQQITELSMLVTGYHT
jgi:hypothetical protein